MILKPLITVSYEYGIQIINTIIVFLIVRFLLYKPVMSVVKKRKEEINANIKEGEKTKADGLALKKEYEEKVSVAREEGQEIIREATIRAERKADDLVSDAKNEALMIKERANKEIEQQKQKAMNDLKASVSDIALLAASKVIEKDIDKAKHEELINKFIDEVGEAK